METEYGKASSQAYKEKQERGRELHFAALDGRLAVAEYLVLRHNVELASRDKGLAEGQFAAFYDGDVCLGSGVIADAA